MSSSADYLVLGLAVWTGGVPTVPATSWAALWPGELELAASVKRCVLTECRGSALFQVQLSTCELNHPEVTKQHP